MTVIKLLQVNTENVLTTVQNCSGC